MAKAKEKAKMRAKKKKIKKSADSRPFNPVILSDEFGQMFQKKFNDRMLKK